MAVSLSTPKLDSYVRSDFPDQNFSTNSLLRAQAGAAPATRMLSYLWGVPPDMPKGAQVVEAYLELTQQYDQTGPRKATLHRVAEPFDVKRVTWNTIPSIVGSDSVSTTSAGATVRGEKWTFDVTAHMQAVANGEDWHGWRLSTDSSATPPMTFWSADAPLAENRPVLRVRWTAAPQAPRNLTPGPGQVVAVPKPVLRWEHIDIVGDTSLTGVRVQINSTDAWTSPAFDSGVVDSSLPQLDLKKTAYAGLPTTGWWWWRAQQRDGAGLWSAWSPAVRISHVPPMTLTITSPSGVVEDVSPRVTWTTSGVQTAYRVILYTKGLKPVWDTGRVPGGVKAIQIPAEKLWRQDRQHRVEVRVWDDQPRVATPGVPVWRSATSDFTPDKDGSLTPPSGLTVTADGDQIAAVLTWRRDTAPDGWVVTRDGITVAHLDHYDVVGAEGACSWVDYSPRPRVSHVYEVYAVLNGRVGASVATTTEADLLTPTGLWVVDPTDGQRVVVLGDGIGDWSLADQTTVHEPLGSPGQVPVYHALGGARGTISGELHSTRHAYGTERTAQEWVDAWLALRERQGRVMRLVGVDRNLPVVLWGMTERPTPYGPTLASAVQASWCQVGEHDGGPM